MSHDAEHGRLVGMLSQVAKEMGKEWKYCRASRCCEGLIHGYGTPEDCETCLGAGKVLSEDSPKQLHDA